MGAAGGSPSYASVRFSAPAGRRAATREIRDAYPGGGLMPSLITIRETILRLLGPGLDSPRGWDFVQLLLYRSFAAK